jgi:hypothetical protein
MFCVNSYRPIWMQDKAGAKRKERALRNIIMQDLIIILGFQGKAVYTIISLQTLHRMPSDTWRHRLVFSTYHFI